MLTVGVRLVAGLEMTGSTLGMVGRTAAFGSRHRALPYATLPIEGQLPVLTACAANREPAVAGRARAVRLETNVLTTETCPAKVLRWRLILAQ